MRKIQYTYGMEDLISRVPGLFPYMEANDIEDMVLHKATDNMQGCYGKIVPEMKLPDEGCELVVTESVEGEEGELVKTVVKYAGKDGKPIYYSYRTLMNYYYEYKEELDEDNEFRLFIEEGIGRVEVDKEGMGFDETENDLVPDYIYLSSTRLLFAELSKYKMIYDTFCRDKNLEEGKHDSDICCACERYVRMGGDKMLDLVKELRHTAEEIAAKYYNYALKEGDTFDTNVKLNIMLTSTENDIGYLSTYISDWQAGEKYLPEDMCFYNGRPKRCIKETTGKFDENTLRIVFDDDAFVDIANVKKGSDEDYILKGYSDSSLKSLRRFRDYVNGRGMQETPEEGEDWLYYYKIGYVPVYSVIKDDLGNIVTDSGLEEGLLQAADETQGGNLAAYGNIITGIEVNADEKTITFEYVTGAHLKAEFNGSEKDDDDNIIYFWKPFQYDADDTHGVKYTETYIYEEEGELDELVKSGGFEDYVNNDDVSDFKKYAFSTKERENSYTKELVSDTISIGYIMSEYETRTVSYMDGAEGVHKQSDAFDSEYKSAFNDGLSSGVFKEDYLCDISFKPDVDSSINIQRGNAAAFERHIKLSEVKTLNDMENYANGSFFAMRT